MRRLFLAAVPFAMLALAAACGDGEDADTTPSDAAANETATRPVNEQPQVPDTPIAKPTPIPDDIPVLQVAGGGHTFSPLRSEFSALPKASVTANGKSYEGVSLAILAQQVGAAEGAVATIQGTRTDNLRLGAIRFNVSEIGASTVFVLADDGHVMLASSSVPPEQWLNDVTGVAFN